MNMTSCLNEYNAARAEHGLTAAPRHRRVILREKGYIVENVSGLSGSNNNLIKADRFCDDLNYFEPRIMRLAGWWKEGPNGYVVYRTHDWMVKSGLN